MSLHCEIMQTADFYFCSLHVDYFEFGGAFTAGSSGGTAGWVIRFWRAFFLMNSWTMPAQIKGTVWCLMLFSLPDAVATLMTLGVKQQLHFRGAITGQLLGRFFSPAWPSVWQCSQSGLTAGKLVELLDWMPCKGTKPEQAEPRQNPLPAKSLWGKAGWLQRKPDTFWGD